jgi:hypothetical protein
MSVVHLDPFQDIINVGWDSLHYLQLGWTQSLGPVTNYSRYTDGPGGGNSCNDKPYVLGIGELDDRLEITPATAQFGYGFYNAASPPGSFTLAPPDPLIRSVTLRGKKGANLGSRVVTILDAPNGINSDLPDEEAGWIYGKRFTGASGDHPRATWTLPPPLTVPPTAPLKWQTITPLIPQIGGKGVSAATNNCWGDPVNVADWAGLKYYNLNPAVNVLNPTTWTWTGVDSINFSNMKIMTDVAGVSTEFLCTGFSIFFPQHWTSHTATCQLLFERVDLIP